MIHDLEKSLNMINRVEFLDALQNAYKLIFMFYHILKLLKTGLNSISMNTMERSLHLAQLLPSGHQNSLARAHRLH